MALNADIIAVQLWLVCRPALRHWFEVTARFIDLKEKKERDFPLTSESRSAVTKIEVFGILASP